MQRSAICGSAICVSCEKKSKGGGKKSHQVDLLLFLEERRDLRRVLLGRLAVETGEERLNLSRIAFDGANKGLVER